MSAKDQHSLPVPTSKHQIRDRRRVQDTAKTRRDTRLMTSKVSSIYFPRNALLRFQWATQYCYHVTRVFNYNTD